MNRSWYSMLLLFVLLLHPFMLMMLFAGAATRPRRPAWSLHFAGVASNSGVSQCIANVNDWTDPSLGIIGSPYSLIFSGVAVCCCTSMALFCHGAMSCRSESVDLRSSRNAAGPWWRRRGPRSASHRRPFLLLTSTLFVTFASYYVLL